MDYKVALYIRLSKEDDNKDNESESVINQRSLLHNFVTEHRLDVFDEYIDDGVSGTTFNRPNFNRLIEDIVQKKVNMVITKDMSRLGRDYILTGYYMEKFFPENRVRYISLLDDIDTGTNNYTNDITPFRAIMNDMYAKDISKKIKSVKEDKQKKGQFIGGKAAYGYMKSPTEKNKIIIDEEAAEMVRRIFNLAVAGVSAREIAVILNNDNVVTPSNYAGIAVSKRGIYADMWSSERVTFMLKNEVYVGNMVQGRVKNLSYKSKKVLKMPPANWIVVEGTHEPIIEREVFDKVQMLLAKRTKTRNRTYDYLLKGLVHCHECGYVLAVINRKLSGNKDTLYFVCRTYQRFTKARKCTCHCVRVEDVENTVLEKVREICRRFIDVSEMQVKGKAELDKLDQASKTEETIRELTAKINVLTNNLDQVYADKLSGTLSGEDFTRIYNRIKDERQNLCTKLNSLKADKSDGVDNSAKAKELANRFLNEIDINKELICSLIDKIELTEDKELIIHWAFSQLDHLQ